MSSGLVVKNLLFFFLALTLGVFVSVLSLFIFMLLFVNLPNEKSTELYQKEYHFYKLNPITNEFFTGIVSLSNYKGGDEGMSYKDDEGSQILISKIDSDRYKCTGSCYCDQVNNQQQQQQRRTTKTIISNGLIFLVAAVSSAFAINLAKKEFEEECKKNNKNTEEEEKCPNDDIYSAIEECKKIEPELGNIVKSYEMSQMFYMCRGRCIPMQWVDVPGENIQFTRLEKQADDMIEDKSKCGLRQMEKFGNSYGCQKLVLEVEKITTLDPFCVEEDSGIRRRRIEEEFVKGELLDFCYARSMEDCTQFLDPMQELEMLKGKLIFPICTGHDLNFKNPLVACVEIPREF